MIDKILNTSTILKLNKNEQRSIKVKGGGGFNPCDFSENTSTDWCCHLPGGCP